VTLLRWITDRGVLLLPLVDILPLCTLALVHSCFSPSLLNSYQPDDDDYDRSLDQDSTGIYRMLELFLGCK
jgi:hypothetical protein